MRPQLLKVLKGPGRSFSVRRDLFPINNWWHYHSEVELLYIKKGEGTLFIGDSIKRFTSGNVFLVGSNLPHNWRFDDFYYQENTKQLVDIRVVHFSENFWGQEFLDLPENISLKKVLEKARRGLGITGNSREKIAEGLEQIQEVEGPRRIIVLIEALSRIAHSKEVVPLSSMGFKPDLVDIEKDRIHAVYEYSIKHFKRKIQLAEIAGVANISPNSFCRYFKSKTRKTYSQFLIELRVGHACKLLIENSQSVKRVCYESGFNNFTSFHKYFKSITGMSPLVYQKEFVSI